MNYRLTLLFYFSLAIPISVATPTYPNKLNVSPVTTADSLIRIEKSHVTFTSGQYKLKGKLIAPKGTNNKVPAIVFCVGSGEGSSYTSSYAAMLDSLLEQNLPLDSVALFYFDKRGIGESEGRWDNTTFEERAADAKAAADYLKTLPFIDSERIAVIGHSQGGWISQICVSKYPETFIGGISMAGPTFNVREQLLNDYTSTLICKELLTEKVARKRAIPKVSLAFFMVSIMPLKGQWKQLQVIKSFDPAKYLTTIKNPFLFMFGENDALVSATNSMVALNKIYPQGLPHNIQTITISGVNHGFKLSELCYNGSWEKLAYSEECKQQIKSWIQTFLLP
ncbi:alpha/beta hydrolase family protein [Pontibacter sp. MBLB2868]|uniref:alpha/beta hydrolase family protein n=1 Tax=Pontibacter sp. MBLB2868 TaxID=3451555 RepID=UPI003F755FC4